MSSAPRTSGSSGAHRHSTNATSRATRSAGDASGLLPTLQGHVDELRTHIMCGICVRPLYEPFTSACGHTFCYSCLSAWFSSNKTCPDCRSPVKAQPAPAYLIRTLVNIFTTRPELLESGETTADHRKYQREETQRLDRDKADTNPRTGGLFKGAFQPKPPIQQPVFDLEDNVFRCPHCSWELEEDSGCVQCGYHPDEDASVTSDGTRGGGSDSDDNSEMTDYLDDEAEDGFDEIDDHGFFGGVPAGGPPAGLLDHLNGMEFARELFDNQVRRIHNGLHGNGDDPNRARGIEFLPVRHGGRRVAPEAMDDNGEDDESEDEEDDYEDADMDSFIEDDINGGAYDPSDHSTVVGDHEPSTQEHYHDSQRSAEAPMSDDDSSGFDEDASEGETNEDEDEDGDEYGDLPELPDEDEDEGDDEDRVQAPPSRRMQQLNGYAPRNPWATHPPPRLQSRGSERSPSAGSSIYSAINVDDESDKSPVAPARRLRDRRYYGSAAY